MAATIKEIAAAAGVSRGTVDRVLHGRPGVKPDVAEHVRKIANEMDFVPNRAGKVLATRKQPIKIGCSLPGKGNAFFDGVISGFRRAEQELADFGVSVEVLSIEGYDPKKHISAIRSLTQSGCSALCVSTVDTPEIRKTVNEIIDKGVPVITVNTDITETQRLCYVGSDYFKAGCTAAGMLSLVIKKEANLLIVTGSLNVKGHNERIRGFSQTLRKKGIKHNLIDTVESFDNDNHAYTQVINALKRHKEINCIYIAAAGVEGTCRAVTDLGMEKEVVVLSYDETSSIRELVHSGVINFTLGQEPETQGYKAIQLMFDYLINNKKIKPGDYITEIVIRISENL